MYNLTIYASGYDNSESVTVRMGLTTDSEMIVSSEELDRFHQHLLALQQAGFDPLATLFACSDRQTEVESDSLERLQRQLDQIDQQIAGTDGSWASIQSVANDWPQYQGALSTWLNHGQHLTALEPLVVSHRIGLNIVSGSRQSLLHVLIYGLLSTIALLSVWGVALGQMRQTIEQLRIQPHWSIQWFMNAQPYFLWFILLLIVVLVAISLRILQRKRGSRLPVQDPAYNSWLRAVQSDQSLNNIAVSTDITQNVPAQMPHSAPLLQWASTIAPETGWERARALTFAEQVYLWISRQQGNRLGRNAPQAFGVALGATVATLAAVSLFYGLVQMLLSLLDLAGGER